MIGKIARFGSNFLGALQYVYFGVKSNRTRDTSTVRGELIYGQGVTITQIPDARLKAGLTHRLNVENIAAAMQASASLNARLRKPVWHQSFAFPPGEHPTNTTLVAICESFVLAFGLAGNQVVAFRHRDKDHDHIHIIANRIDQTGRNTAQDSQNYKRTARFCRQMEIQHGLTPTRHLTSEQLDGKRLPADNPVADRLRQSIDHALPVCQHLDELADQLRLQSVELRVGRGIVLVDKQSGQLVRGSALGRDYSLSGLQHRLAQSPDAQVLEKPVNSGQHLEQLRNAIDQVRQIATDIASFTEQLRHHGYAAVTSERADSNGKRQVGIVYSKTFAGGAERWVSGSALGADYTHRALLAYFTSRQTEGITLVDERPTENKQLTEAQRINLKPNL